MHGDTYFIHREFIQCMLAMKPGFDPPWITGHHSCDYPMNPEGVEKVAESVVPSSVFGALQARTA